MRKRILAALLAWLVAAVGALAEDAIAPDAFSFTGGTGRVTMSIKASFTAKSSLRNSPPSRFV